MFRYTITSSYKIKYMQVSCRTAVAVEMSNEGRTIFDKISHWICIYPNKFMEVAPSGSIVNSNTGRQT